MDIVIETFEKRESQKGVFMKKKSASLWILILLIISSLTAPAEAAKKVREDHLVYQKDRELWITNGKHEPVKLTEGLYSKYFERTIDIRPLLSYGKEGRMLLIPQKIGSDISETKSIYDLFYVDLMDNTYPLKKIDESVLCHEAGDKNQVIYYEKLIEDFKGNEYTRKFEIYRFDFNQKEKVAEGRIEAVSNDGRIVLFVDNDTLYKKTVGQEVVKIVENVLKGSVDHHIVEFDKSFDTVYYAENDYIKGKHELYKKVKNAPAEKVLENCGPYFLYENTFDETSYRNGTFYYFKENPGEDETKKTYGDFAVDDITPQIYERMNESGREKVDLLRRTMNFDIDRFFTDRKLYFYDGKKSHLVEEGELVHPIGNHLMDPSHHQGRLSVYPMLNRDSFPKVKLSEVLERDSKNRERVRAKRSKNFPDDQLERWWRGATVEDILEGMVRERLTQHHIFEDGKRIGVLKGGVNLRFSKTPGELLFFRNITYPSVERGDFYSVRLENNKLVSPKLIRKDLSISPVNIQLYENSLMQKKSMYVGEDDGVYGGEGHNLYAEGKGVLTVNQEQVDYNPSADMVLFYAKKSRPELGTLDIYYKGEARRFSEVYGGLGQIGFFNDSYVVFRKYTGKYPHSYDLMLFDGEKERLIAEEVDEFIVAGPCNYDEETDRP